MAIPVAVTLDRGDQGSLDLTPLLEPGSLTWSSVVPGGFASCSFQVNGDFRRLVKQFPYLSIVRVVGDSGRVLFEGQIEDLAPTLSRDTVGVKVGVFGLQNALKEQSVCAIWSKRDMNWTPMPVGSALTTVIASAALSVTTGQYDPTDLTKSGVQISAAQNGSLGVPAGAFAQWILPPALGNTLVNWLGSFTAAGTDTGTTKWTHSWWNNVAGTWSNLGTNTGSGTSPFHFTPSANVSALAVGVHNNSAGAYTPAANDATGFFDMRVLGVLANEDVTDGFYGDTLIKSLINTYVPALGLGVIESGQDFTIDHLDATVRLTAYDILQEVASYYTREWAVWENALLDWRTPHLQEPQWIIPLASLTALDLDASTVNSQRSAVVLYTDAASGQPAAQSATSTDRRNPYVLKSRAKDTLNPQGFRMTSSTASQLATALLNDLGFGPVPAAGSISLPGETIVGHASGAARKAWEIRAGDNVTIPELPMADIFTQDGRGEVLFHVVSAEASSSDGSVTLSLDSYGSKRSDVLLARLAAVTKALGG